MPVSPRVEAQQALLPSSPRSLFTPDMIHGPSTVPFTPIIHRFESNTNGGCSSQFLQQVIASSPPSYSTVDNFHTASAVPSSSTSTLPFPFASSSSSLQPIQTSPDVTTTHFDALNAGTGDFFPYADVDPVLEWLPIPSSALPTSPTGVNHDLGYRGCPAITNARTPSFGGSFINGLPTTSDLHALPVAPVASTSRHDNPRLETVPTVPTLPTPSNAFQEQTSVGTNSFRGGRSQFTTTAEARNFSSGGVHNRTPSGALGCLGTTADPSRVEPDDIVNAAENIDSSSAFSQHDGPRQRPSTHTVENLTHFPLFNSTSRDTTVTVTSSSTSTSTSTSTSQPISRRFHRDELVPLVFPELPTSTSTRPSPVENMPARRNGGRSGRTPTRGSSASAPLVFPSSSSSTVTITRTSRKRDSGVVGLDEDDTPTKRTKRKRNGSPRIKSRPTLYTDDEESVLDDDILDLRGDIIPDFATEEKKEKGEMIKLSQFQCAICMDFATSLTVTHCGHLFCGECLTNALAIENQKNKCPICRQKIEHKPNAMAPNGRTTKNNKGYYPLELKLATVAKKTRVASGTWKIGGPSKR